MYITTFIAFITIQTIPFVQTEDLSCFVRTNTTSILFPDKQIDARIATIIPELEGFRISNIQQLTPEENKKFRFDKFSRNTDNPTILFIISPDGINEEDGYPLMNFVNEQQDFHGIKQITDNGQIKLDAVQIRYQRWIEAHITCKTRLIEPLLLENFFCEDFEGSIDKLVKTWMRQTLDKAISLKQNIVWMDAMKDDAFFATILKKVRKGQYQMKFIFAVGDKATVVFEAENENRRVMMKYDKSQYYKSLRLINDLASDFIQNKMSEDMQCIMSNGDSTPIEEIDYETMIRFIQSYTKSSINHRIRNWYSMIKTGIGRRIRTDPNTVTQLKKQRKQDKKRKKLRIKGSEDEDATPSSGVISFKDLGTKTKKKHAQKFKDLGNDSGSSESDSGSVESIRGATSFAFWFGLVIVTVFMSLFGVIL